jgi:UDP-N-acetylglucosamine:LPS N-acetylglucosamine transferase
VLDDAALATPDWDWEVVGPPAPVRPPTMARHLGWVDDVDAVVHDADVLVGPPGNGVVALVARTGVPYVALPCERPFDEQHAHADRLEAAGVAVVRRSWPTAGEWPAVLDAASGLDRDRVRVLRHEGAARRAADAILAVAEVRAPVASR